MPDAAEFAARGVFIGLAGAAAMDLWSLLLRRRFDIKGLDYAHATRGGRRLRGV